MTTDSKRAKLIMRIGTHNGTFHADEALAVYMLRLLSKYKDATVVRSRTPEILDACDIVVDVSAKYDGIKYFDHHQKGFEETFSREFNTKLSSAGLIFKHFGKEIISSTVDLAEADPTVVLLHNKIYASMIEAIDGSDNGIPQYPDDIQKAYDTRSITLPGMVASLNPTWNEESSDEILYTQFLKASELMGSTFMNVLKYYCKSWLPARDIVAQALNEATKYDPEGRIVVFDQFTSWKDHIFKLETELGYGKRTLYVLYSDGKGWRIQAVPLTSSSFQSRKALPEAWRGVRDDDLSELSGIEGCVFVHASGFIGGNQTREGALKMAYKAIEL
ncbi:metal-dependent protein hydrolase [Lipomyces oligophaga]|uniref:metal-dependent protein hydrolase n=1 Tax=Lipomyces oligophaga TaxID=45792 RepID=UPI0034CEF2F4